MDNASMKEYLKSIFELESALFSNQQLMEQYQNNRRNSLPNKPELLLPTPPHKPIAPAKDDGMGSYLLVFAISLVAGIAVMLVSDSDEIFLKLGGIFLIGLGIFALIYGLSSKYEDSNATSKYNSDYNNYKNEKREYDLEEKQARKQYLHEMSIFDKLLTEHDKKTLNQMNELQSVEEKLENALNKLYDKNIIYPKYRNLVAISTIFEYFDSGRCTELEGTNGAYNMYENELRQNLIIASLSIIISDIQKIKNSQYTLYQQLSKSNAMVNSLLCDIDNTAKKTEYYANAAAVAASSDRVICGMTF